jgi:DNA-binding NtrC family response regulator
VVHDDPTFRDPLVASLKAEGHDVVGFSDSVAAWDALAAARLVELLVTRVDFGDGHPHGISLALSARNRRPEVQILFVARSIFQKDAEGIGEFLALPVSVPEVAESVARILASETLGRGAP